MDSLDNSSSNADDDNSIEGQQQFRPADMIPYLRIGKELQELRHTVYSMHLSEIANESSSDESSYSDDETVNGDADDRVAGQYAGTGNSFITPSYNSISNRLSGAESAVRGTILQMEGNEVPSNVSGSSSSHTTYASGFKQLNANKFVSFKLAPEGDTGSAATAAGEEELIKIRELSKYLSELIGQYSARVLLGTAVSVGAGVARDRQQTKLMPSPHKEDSFQTPDLMTQKTKSNAGNKDKGRGKYSKKDPAAISIQVQQAVGVEVDSGDGSNLELTHMHRLVDAHVDVHGGKLLVTPVKSATVSGVEGQQMQCPSTETDSYEGREKPLTVENLRDENLQLRRLVESFQSSIDDNLAALGRIQDSSLRAAEEQRTEKRMHEVERGRWAEQMQVQARNWEETVANMNRQSETSRAELQTAYMALSEEHDAHVEAQEAVVSLEQQLAELTASHSALLKFHSDVQDKFDGYTEQISALEVSIREKELAVARLQAAVTEFKAASASSQTVSDTVAEQQHGESHEVARLQGELALLRFQYEKLACDQATAAAQHSELLGKYQSEITAVRSQCHNLSAENARMVAHNIELLSKHQSELALLREQSDDLSSVHAAAVVQHATTVTSLRSEFEAERSSAVGIQQQQQTALVSAHQAELALLRCQYNELASQHASVVAHNTELMKAKSTELLPAAQNTPTAASAAAAADDDENHLPALDGTTAADLRRALNQKDVELKQSKHELTEYMANQADLQLSELASFEEQVTTLSKELDEKDAELEKLRSALEKSQAQRDVPAAEVERLESELSEANQTIANYLSQVEMQGVAIDRMQQEMELLRREEVSLQAEISRHCAERVAELTVLLEPFEEVHMQSKADGLHEEGKVSYRYKAIQDGSGSTNDAVNESGEALLAMDRALDCAQQGILSLGSEHKLMAAELSQLKTQGEARAAEVERLKNEVLSREDTIATLESCVLKNKAIVQNLEGQEGVKLEQLKCRNNELQEESLQMKQSVGQLQTLLAESRECIAELEVELADARQERSTSKVEMTQRMVESSVQVTGLEEDLDRYRHVCMMLQDQLTGLKTLERDTAVKDSTIEELATQLDSLQSASRNLSEQVAVLQALSQQKDDALAEVSVRLKEATEQGVLHATRLAALRSLVDQREIELSEMSTQLATTKADHVAALAAMSTAQATAETNALEANAVVTELNDQLEYVKVQSNAALLKLSDQMMAMEEASAAKDSTIAQLTELTDTLTASEGEKYQKIFQLTSHVNMLEEEAAGQERVVVTLREQLTESNNEIDVMRIAEVQRDQSIAQLTDQLRVLRDNIQSLQASDAIKDQTISTMATELTKSCDQRDALVVELQEQVAALSKHRETAAVPASPADIGFFTPSATPVKTLAASSASSSARVSIPRVESDHASAAAQVQKAHKDTQIVTELVSAQEGLTQSDASVVDLQEQVAVLSDALNPAASPSFAREASLITPSETPAHAVGLTQAPASIPSVVNDYILTELSVQLKAAQAEGAQKDVVIASLTSENSTVQASLVEKETAIAVLTFEHEELSAASALMSEEMTQLTVQLSHTQNTLAAREAAIKELSQRLHAYDTDDSRQQSPQSVNSSPTSSVLTQLATQLEYAEAAAARKDRAIAELYSEMTAAESIIAEKDDALTELTVQLDVLRSAASASSRVIGQLTSHGATLRAAVDEKGATNAELASQLSGLVASESVNEGALSELMSQLETAQASVALKEEAIVSLTEELSAARATVVDSEAARVKLVAQLQDVRESHISMNEVELQLSSRASSVQDMSILAERDNKILLLTDELAGREALVSMLTNKLEDAREQIAVLELRQAATEEGVDSLCTHNARTVEVMQNRINELQNQLQEQKQKQQLDGQEQVEGLEVSFDEAVTGHLVAQVRALTAQKRELVNLISVKDTLLDMHKQVSLTATVPFTELMESSQFQSPNVSNQDQTGAGSRGSVVCASRTWADADGVGALIELLQEENNELRHALEQHRQLAQQEQENQTIGAVIALGKEQVLVSACTDGDAKMGPMEGFMEDHSPGSILYTPETQFSPTVTMPGTASPVRAQGGEVNDDPSVTTVLAPIDSVSPPTEGKKLLSSRFAAFVSEPKQLAAADVMTTATTTDVDAPESAVATHSSFSLLDSPPVDQISSLPTKTTLEASSPALSEGSATAAVGTVYAASLIRYQQRNAQLLSLMEESRAECCEAHDLIARLNVEARKLNKVIINGREESSVLRGRVADLEALLQRRENSLQNSVDDIELGAIEYQRRIAELSALVVKLQQALKSCETKLADAEAQLREHDQSDREIITLMSHSVADSEAGADSNVDSNSSIWVPISPASSAGLCDISAVGDTSSSGFGDSADNDAPPAPASATASMRVPMVNPIVGADSDSVSASVVHSSSLSEVGVDGAVATVGDSKSTGGTHQRLALVVMEQCEQVKNNLRRKFRAEWQNEGAQLQRQLDAALSELQTMRVAMHAYQQQYAGALQEREEADAISNAPANVDTKQELEAQQQEEEAEVEFATLHRELAAVQAEELQQRDVALRLLTEECAGLRRESAQAERRYMELQEVESEHTERLLEKETVISALKSSQRELLGAAELAQLALTRREVELELKLEGLKANNKELTELLMTQQRNEASGKELWGELLAEERSKHESELEAAAARYAALQSELSETEQQLLVFNQELEAFQAQNAQLQGELQQLRQQQQKRVSRMRTEAGTVTSEGGRVNEQHQEQEEEQQAATGTINVDPESNTATLPADNELASPTNFDDHVPVKARVDALELAILRCRSAKLASEAQRNHTLLDTLRGANAEVEELSESRNELVHRVEELELEAEHYRKALYRQRETIDDMQTRLDATCSSSADSGISASSMSSTSSKHIDSPVTSMQSADESVSANAAAPATPVGWSDGAGVVRGIHVLSPFSPSPPPSTTLAAAQQYQDQRLRHLYHIQHPDQNQQRQQQEEQILGGLWEWSSDIHTCSSPMDVATHHVDSIEAGVALDKEQGVCADSSSVVPFVRTSNTTANSPMIATDISIQSSANCSMNSKTEADTETEAEIKQRVVSALVARMDEFQVDTSYGSSVDMGVKAERGEGMKHRVDTAADHNSSNSNSNASLERDLLDLLEIEMEVESQMERERKADVNGAPGAQSLTSEHGAYAIVRGSDGSVRLVDGAGSSSSVNIRVPGSVVDTIRAIASDKAANTVHEGTASSTSQTSILASECVTVSAWELVTRLYDDNSSLQAALVRSSDACILLDQKLLQLQEQQQQQRQGTERGENVNTGDNAGTAIGASADVSARECGLPAFSFAEALAVMESRLAAQHQAELASLTTLHCQTTAEAASAAAAELTVQIARSDALEEYILDLMEEKRQLLDRLRHWGDKYVCVTVPPDSLMDHSRIVLNNDSCATSSSGSECDDDGGDDNKFYGVPILDTSASDTTSMNENVYCAAISPIADSTPLTSVPTLPATLATVSTPVAFLSPVTPAVPLTVPLAPMTTGNASMTVVDGVSVTESSTQQQSAATAVLPPSLGAMSVVVKVDADCGPGPGDDNALQTQLAKLTKQNTYLVNSRRRHQKLSRHQQLCIFSLRMLAQDYRRKWVMAAHADEVANEDSSVESTLGPDDDEL